MLTATALSGGIDSLVSAYLLKESGVDIIGLHFLTGYESARHPDTSDADGCSGHSIGRIADQLSIPVHVIDISEVFKKQVIEYFTGAYASGRTPNPCMICNEKIKFGVLLNEAGKLGASSLATGHYARIAESGGRFRLLRGLDPVKDQSYFLAMLSQQQLGHARFPLGGMTKKDVISLARAKGLQPVSTKESQDICFISGGSYCGFLESETALPQGPGPIVDPHGNVLGRHTGLHRYTIGQRRGINCPGPAPYYVLRLDVRRNRLIVGPENELYTSECHISKVNWLAPPPPDPVRVRTRIRYRHHAADSTLTPLGAESALITFDTPQAAITPGQAAVCYQGDEVVAAGWIEDNHEINL